MESGCAGERHLRHVGVLPRAAAAAAAATAAASLTPTCPSFGAPFTKKHLEWLLRTGDDAVVPRLRARMADARRALNAKAASLMLRDSGVSVAFDFPSLRGSGLKAKVVLSFAPTAAAAAAAAEVDSPDSANSDPDSHSNTTSLVEWWDENTTRAEPSLWRRWLAPYTDEELWRRRLRGAITGAPMNLQLATAAHLHQAVVVCFVGVGVGVVDESNKAFARLRASADAAGVTRRPPTRRTETAKCMGVVERDDDAVVLFGSVSSRACAVDPDFPDRLASTVGVALAWKLFDNDGPTEEEDRWFREGM